LETIPWGKIIGLRNKLAHDYGEILAERIWNISKTLIMVKYVFPAVQGIVPQAGLTSLRKSTVPRPQRYAGFCFRGC
jgi:hypothetical protein